MSAIHMFEETTPHPSLEPEVHSPVLPGKEWSRSLRDASHLILFLQISPQICSAIIWGLCGSVCPSTSGRPSKIFNLSSSHQDSSSSSDSLPNPDSKTTTTCFTNSNTPSKGFMMREHVRSSSWDCLRLGVSRCKSLPAASFRPITGSSTTATTTRTATPSPVVQIRRWRIHVPSGVPSSRDVFGSDSGNTTSSSDVTSNLSVPPPPVQHQVPEERQRRRRRSDPILAIGESAFNTHAPSSGRETQNLDEFSENLQVEHLVSQEDTDDVAVHMLSRADY
ncbi:hypothetical protein MLD38_035473 [Melastoma candidum]|uniref:Uncharacterized protein n=1 Tax=Melastoma candidum TaxID=119954 RepID=A0ACB9LHA7_9MYRT|nr:hypothetical protein MLD38_035473 [Melastoma candidum]